MDHPLCLQRSVRLSVEEICSVGDSAQRGKRLGAKFELGKSIARIQVLVQLPGSPGCSEALVRLHTDTDPGADTLTSRFRPTRSCSLRFRRAPGCRLWSR